MKLDRKFMNDIHLIFSIALLLVGDNLVFDQAPEKPKRILQTGSASEAHGKVLIQIVESLSVRK